MIERLARLGYLSIAIVYVIVGALAIRGAAPDHDDALKVIREQPFGRTMLFLIAAGLAGYAVWRVASGITNSEYREHNAKGLVLRLGSIGRGLIHAVIALEVFRLVMRHGQGESSDQVAKHWTARLFDLPLGRALVVAAALGILAYGIYQLYAGAKGKLSRQLGGLGPAATNVSRFGLAARGVVFLVIGVSVALAALRYDSSRARGMSGALRQLREPADGWLLVLVGAGLIAYGVYAVINARYRRIAAT